MEDYSIPSSGAIIGRWLAQKINEKINNHNSNSNDYDYPNIIEFRVDSPAKYNKPPLADYSELDSLDKSLRLANLNDSQELKKVKELLNINGMPEFAKVYWLSMRYLKDQTQENVFDQARLCFESMIEADPENPNVWNNYGVLCLKYDKIDEAGEKFQQAYNIAPNHTEAKQNLKIIENRKINNPTVDILCSHCNTKLKKDAVFCPNCGNRI